MNEKCDPGTICLICYPARDDLFQDNARETLAKWGVDWHPEYVF